MVHRTRYFDHLSSVEEIKKLYRQLAMQHHPDRGGDLCTMQEVNAQYHEALKRVDRQETIGDDGQAHTYYYNEDIEQAIMDKVADLISAGVLDHAEVYIIGTWVWIIGDTRPIKETLKEQGCRWHSKRVCWYWKPYSYRSSYSNTDLGGLAQKYGATKVTRKEEEKQRILT